MPSRRWWRERVVVCSDCRISLLPGPPWYQTPALHGPATTTNWNPLKLWTQMCVSVLTTQELLQPFLSASHTKHNLTNCVMALPPLLWPANGGSTPHLSESKAGTLCWIISVYFPGSQEPKILRPGHRPPKWPSPSPRIPTHGFFGVFLFAALLQLSLYRCSAKVTTWSCRPLGYSHVHRWQQKLDWLGGTHQNF